MERVEETKLRLLREVVQDNIGGERRVKPRFYPARKAIFPLWLWGCFVIAGMAYIFAPSQVVSTGQTTAPDSSGLERPEPSSHIETRAPEPDIPHEAPRPLNRAVFPLSVKKIVIDAGHGGGHTGAISESGISEKEITLDIALRLRRLMEETSFQAVLTRQTDQTMSLQKRVAFANSNNADLFVSIHVNWMEPRQIRPLETYFVGPTEDPAVIKLVSMENQESGYSLSDYRQLLEKVYIHTRRDESRRLAETIHTELYYALREINPNIHNRGVKTAPFVVLIGTQMPAILAEVSCLSNEDEVRLLTNGDYREKIASALLKGIRSYANGLNGSAKKGS
ncbi:MAG: N-acetylmuramoyl-L-alanine amidase family protein [Candidatus Binatia bacterium]